MSRDGPWWGNPWFWLAVCVGTALLGIVVFPKLFGFTFLFLPFIWIAGRRRKPPDPGAN